MKELTIEEKAKAYDEAIERAKLSRALILDIGKEATEIEYIFPELKEPKEDIRLYMINMIKSIRYNNTVYGWFQDGKDEEMLNWLEKQGKEMSMKSCAEYYYNKSSELNMPELSDFQNELATILMEREYDGPSETEDDIERGRLEYELAAIRISERLLPLVTREEKPTEKQDEQKSVDKIEPKFKVGDIIKYVGEREEFSKENHTIKKILDDCYLTIDDMHIPFKFEEYYIPIEQNPAWSEEDEKIINALRTVCLLCSHNEMDGRPWHKWADWLKSLKDKIYPKSKQEWSEEDDCNSAFVVELLLGEESLDKEYISQCKKAAMWLKSLKERCTWKLSEVKNETKNKCPNYSEGYGCSTSPLKQCDTCPDYKLYNHWKPSEEQTMALRWVLNHIPYDSHKEEISGLLEQLKKLM